MGGDADGIYDCKGPGQCVRKLNTEIAFSNIFIDIEELHASDIWTRLC